MINLSDTQRILLSNATQRGDGSLLPLADTLKPGGGTAKATAALIRNGLAEERVTSDPAAVRRSEGNIDYGVFITLAGGAAIGIDLAEDGNGDASGLSVAVAAAPAATPTPVGPRAASKSAAVIALLSRTEGATLPELITATSWLPHTTRAALTGLRKKGYAITRGKRDGATCYCIVEAA
ncbi:DUF3489 domain-containing protein [Sphingomonas sp. A2-49]|uniref:DUF3489 domain-containing protein n=1 Tax=Sphingomonas sp. A2-49 TaxID=1391375 RepID=UPI0021D208F3|nr:DUF3489 domain-containing protein [Sphingomonas sp. A2-49]MCU6455266.1 DUF3489 domain-containing protein [Sphingomonas sp. A2-49]